MRFAWLVCSCACACASQPQSRSQTIDVPLVDERDDETAPPTRSATVEEKHPEDLLSYYVDTWDGMVNDTYPTELRVDSTARFFINLKANPKLAACHLAGKVSVTDSKLWFEIEESTCKAEYPGMMLIRTIIKKTEREFTLVNEDGSLTIHYARRAR